MSIQTVIPNYLLDDSCFVCGSESKHTTAAGHEFWSNKQAKADFKVQATNAGDSWYYDQSSAYVD